MGSQRVGHEWLTKYGIHSNPNPSPRIWVIIWGVSTLNAAAPWGRGVAPTWEMACILLSHRMFSWFPVSASSSLQGWRLEYDHPEEDFPGSMVIPQRETSLKNTWKVLLLHKKYKTPDYKFLRGITSRMAELQKLKVVW